MQKKKIIFISSGLAVLALLLVAAPSMAATVKNSAIGRGMMGRIGNFKPLPPGATRGPAIGQGTAGKISAINGAILTVTGNNKITYSIDASSAKITAGFGPKGQALTLANLTVGEMIFAQGTVSGTNLTAATIYVLNNSAPGRINSPKGLGFHRGMNGKVTAVNGASFTLQGNGRFMGVKNIQNVSFTVNTNASTVFKKDGQTAALGDVATGETVMVTGAVDATSSLISANAVNIIIKQPVTPKKTNPSIINRFLNFFKKK